MSYKLRAMSCELSAANKSYPAQYESRLTLKNGKQVFVRPVVQSDEPLIVDLLNKLSPDSIYLRFLRPVKTLPKELLIQLTHLDYRKNFALAVVIREDEKDTIIAVARYGYDPDLNVTDFAITVRDDWQRCGLGEALLTKLFAIGKEHGISCFVSLIDSTNHTMKHLLRKMRCSLRYAYRNGCTEVAVFV